MGRTGDNGVKSGAVPEEIVLDFRIIKQVNITVQIIFFLGIVLVAHIALIAHSRLKNTAAVKTGVVVVEHLGRIPDFCHLRGN